MTSRRDIRRVDARVPDGRLPLYLRRLEKTVFHLILRSALALADAMKITCFRVRVIPVHSQVALVVCCCSKN